MRIGEIYQPEKCAISMEIFPPKTEDGDALLRRTLEKLTAYQPAFISCTYGAGGSTQQRTLDWSVEIQMQYQQTATSHFTCVGATRDELINWLTMADNRGIQNIMALRGDPPAGEETFQKKEGGLQYANELVALIREHFPDMGIGVAGYPEKHPTAPDAKTDLLNLKRKVDAGADAVYTQLFYDNDQFLKFRDQYQQAGIDVPLIPGIMPITNFSRIQRITSMCGASIPQELFSQLEKAQEDKEAQFEIGVQFAIKQCSALIDAGVPGIHLYVLNRNKATEQIMQALGYGL